MALVQFAECLPSLILWMMRWGACVCHGQLQRMNGVHCCGQAEERK